MDDSIRRRLADIVASVVRRSVASRESETSRDGRAASARAPVLSDAQCGALEELRRGIVEDAALPDLPPSDAWRVWLERLRARVGPPLGPPGAEEELEGRGLGDGLTWFSAPWWFVELFAYRCILAHTEPGQDPFGPHKEDALLRDGAVLLETSEELLDRARAGNDEAWLHALVLRSLWGNRADLSMSGGEVSGVPHAKEAAVAQAEGADDLERELAESGLIRDDSRALASRLVSCAGRVVLVLDNAGPEFLTDLFLVHALLSLGRVAHVELHIKTDPVFVSDVTEPDVELHLAFLESHPAAFARAVAATVRAALADGRLSLLPHAFYVSPARVHPDISRLYAAADVVVLKGDANFRRIVEDRRWDPTTPLHVAWAPVGVDDGSVAPAVASLRTLKSESLVGIHPDALARADRAFGDGWRVSGTVGHISLLCRP